jgi:pyruvyltransferase
MQKSVEWVPHNYNEDHYFAIGSILQKANSKTIVWGSGLISDELMPYRKPKEILAVRGPLTKKALEFAGIKCPSIYGDPALLLPNYFYPKIEKRYKIGIVPHYVDLGHKVLNREVPNDVLIIEPTTTDIDKFVGMILSCDKIISSSLHGLIISDAYGIPSVQVKFSDQIFGDGFKYEDYFMSVSRKYEYPTKLSGDFIVSDLQYLKFDIARKINTEALERANPFCFG